ncbi:MAG: EAL domain-containing protein [Clostridia bacterium]
MIYVICGMGLIVSAFTCASALYNSEEYSVLKTSAKTGIFLSVICALFSLYYFSYDGTAVFDLKFVFLCCVAACYDRKVLLWFSPLYLVGVFFSPFSIWFALAELGIAFLILSVKTEKIASLFLLLLTIPTVAFCEAVVYDYAGIRNGKLLWVLGILVAVIILISLAGLITAIFQNRRIPSTLKQYIELVFAKNLELYPFKIDRKSDNVIFSERFAEYFEMKSTKVPLELFRQIITIATDGSIDTIANGTQKSIFITPVTCRNLYVTYGCFPRFFGGYKGFIRDITAKTPRYEMVYSSTEKDYPTGLPTYAVIKDRLLYIAKKSSGRLLLVTLEVSASVGQSTVYDVEFEHQCQMFLINSIKNTFPGASMFFTKNGEYTIVIPSIADRSEISSSIETLKNIFSGRYTIGTKSFSYVYKAGFLFENAGAIIDYDSINLLLAKLIFSKLKLRDKNVGDIYLFSEEDYEEYQAYTLRIQNLPAIFENKQISLYYQPIVNLSKGETELYEVLLRVNDEIYSELDVFIDDCIREGLDIELDRMIWKKLQSNLESHEIPIVNLSVNMFGNTPIGDSVKKIADILTSAGCCLYIEFTEHINVSEKMQDSRFIQATRCGAKLIADDYGINYSNLELLFRTKFDFVKIPQKFVQNIDKNKHNEVFTKSIIDFASNIGVKCVVEGVETIEELKKIMELGANYVQGYYFDKPLKDIPTEYKKYDIPKFDIDIPKFDDYILDTPLLPENPIKTESVATHEPIFAPKSKIQPARSKKTPKETNQSFFKTIISYFKNNKKRR